MERSKPHDFDREVQELKQGLDILKIPHNTRSISYFLKYLDILYDYEGKVHLLSRGDYECISKRHFLPSLVALPHVTHCRTVCDIGAGAGFPSIPLKIFTPGIHYTLFESIKKKAHFLKTLVEELQLQNVEIIDERAEQCSNRKFDLALFKAVGKIQKMLGLIDSFLVPQGRAIFFKSPAVQKELDETKGELAKYRLHARLEKLSTPLEHRPLILVIIERSY
jgi:16S rRNA (guanine527-N7)-methyltransferase